MTDKQFKAPKSIKFLGYPLKLDFESDLFPRTYCYKGLASKGCEMTVNIDKSRKWHVGADIVYGKGAKTELNPYYIAYASGGTFREAIGNAQKDALKYVKVLFGLVTHDPRPAILRFEFVRAIWGSCARKNQNR